MTKDELVGLYRKYAQTTHFANLMPDQVVYSWALSESGLRYDDISTLGERGYMQVDKAWAKDNGWSVAKFEGLAASPAASMEGSVEYIERSATHVDGVLTRKAPPLRYGDTFWYMVKLYHGLPLLFNSVVAASPTPASVADVVNTAHRLAEMPSGSPLDQRPRGKDWRPIVIKILKNTSRAVPTAAATDLVADARTDAALERLLKVSEEVGNG